ncbi:Hypothetical protein A7982_05138 [Minicystis rosea]|nr:Hypothetical protein A7982_05138 [Minicystis rosea]
MATTAEQDDHDEKNEDAEGASAEEPKAEAAPAPKPNRPSGKRPAKRARPAPPPQQGTSLGKSMILFVLIIGGLAAGFALLGSEKPQEQAKPKWKVGDTADVEITLVKNDRQELSCASSDEIGGKHCAFEGANKPWSKGDNGDDKKLLKPYTTTDRIQFTAAGVWSEPALAADKIPATRFSVKCKYKVEGTLKNVSVRWESTGQWFPGNEWYAGSVSDCKVAP